MLKKFSKIFFGDWLVSNVPLQVNLFSVPDGFVIVTFSSHVFAALVKLVSSISDVPHDKP